MSMATRLRRICPFILIGLMTWYLVYFCLAAVPLLFHQMPMKVCNYSLANETPNPDRARVLFMVLSSLSDMKARAALRSSWGQWLRLYDGRVHLRFILGQGDTFQPALEIHLVEEQERYGDLVKLSQFQDTYLNLTLKVLFGMQHVFQHFPHLHYIVKVDVDVFVNVPNLLAELWQAEKESPSSGFILGHVEESAKPERDPKGKWFTSQHLYNRTTYPHYVNGPCYAMPSKTAKRLLSHGLKVMSSNVSLIKWEDVLMTGIWREEIDAEELLTEGDPIQLVTSKKFINTKAEDQNPRSYTEQPWKWTALHHVEPQDMERWWKQLSCHQTKASSQHQEEVFEAAEEGNGLPGLNSAGTGDENSEEDNAAVISEKVHQLANALYQEFESMISQYGDRVVENLLPITVAMLETMNNLYEVKHDQDIEIELLKEDGEQLLSQYEKEKEARKSAQERMMSIEDMYLLEARAMEEKIANLESSLRMLEIRAKSSQDLANRMSEKEEETRKECQVLNERYRDLLRNAVERSKPSPSVGSGSEVTLTLVRDEPIRKPIAVEASHSNLSSAACSQMSALEADSDYEQSLSQLTDNITADNEISVNEEVGEDLGISREIDNMLKENAELYETKEALNIVKTDLINQLDALAYEKAILHAQNEEVSQMRDQLQERCATLTSQLAEWKQKAQQLENKLNEENQDESNLPYAQRKRFTRTEMARVLLERNQYKERLMELQEAVVFTESLRANREQMNKNKNSSIWNSFMSLLGGGGGEESSAYANYSSRVALGSRPLRPPGQATRATNQQPTDTTPR